jgi:hypothetical protein
MKPPPVGLLIPFSDEQLKSELERRELERSAKEDQEREKRKVAVECPVCIGIAESVENHAECWCCNGTKQIVAYRIKDMENRH